MSMQGKVVVVTGSNTGIGLETAVGVAAQEATTVLACRNQAKAEAAAKEVVRRTWNDDVHVVPLDLADLASVRKAADEISSRWDRLDVLVNNAGGTWSQRQVTAQGFEYTMGVNHLGHFYLTLQLLHRLQRSARRASSTSPRSGTTSPSKGMRFDDLQSEKRLRRHGGLLPGQAGQRALHPRAGPPARRRRRSRPTPPTRVGSAAASAWTATSPASWGSASALIRPLPDQPQARRQDVDLPGHVAGGRGRRRACTGCVRSPGHMGRQARDDEAAVRLWDESERLLASVGFAVG